MICSKIHVARADSKSRTDCYISSGTREQAENGLNRLNSLWTNKRVSEETVQIFEDGDLVTAVLQITSSDEDGIDRVISTRNVSGRIAGSGRNVSFHGTDGHYIALPYFAINGCASVLKNIEFKTGEIDANNAARDACVDALRTAFTDYVEAARTDADAARRAAMAALAVARTTYNAARAATDAAATLEGKKS